MPTVLSCGQGFTAVITADSKGETALYCFGSLYYNADGYWGPAPEEGLLQDDFQHEPLRETCLDNKQPIAVNCGTYWISIVTKTGDLYTWGPPGRGGAEGNYLGHPVISNDIGQETWPVESVPRKVAGIDGPVRTTVCGDIQMGCISDGALYTWGEGENYGLGHGTSQHQDVPKQVKALKKVRVKRAAFSFGNSGAIDEQGSLYLWGSSDPEGQWATTAGLTAKEPTQFKFGGFPREHTIVDVACAHWYTVVCLQEQPRLRRQGEAGGEAPSELLLLGPTGSSGSKQKKKATRRKA